MGKINKFISKLGFPTINKTTNHKEVYELNSMRRNIGTSTPKPTDIVSTLNQPDQNGEHINVVLVNSTPLGHYEEEN